MVWRSLPVSTLQSNEITPQGFRTIHFDVCDIALGRAGMRAINGVSETTRTKAPPDSN